MPSGILLADDTRHTAMLDASSTSRTEARSLREAIRAAFSDSRGSVLRFKQIIEFIPEACEINDVMDALQTLAHLVQGCWVICSALSCGGDTRRERDRDRILLQFARRRTISSRDLMR